MNARTTFDNNGTWRQGRLAKEPPVSRIGRQPRPGVSAFAGRSAEKGLGVLALGAFLLLTSLCFGPRLSAAETSSALAANDLRQLWPRKAWDLWENKSEEELKRLAKDGQPAAQYMLSFKWSTKPAQRVQAQAMLEAAARAGLPQALFELGSSKSAGEDWPLIQKAAEARFIPAELYLANHEAGFYTKYGTNFGTNLPPNLNRALGCFRHAADNGSLEAMTRLAFLYSSGVGEPRTDADSPHRLLVLAAVQGSREAMYQLSDRYAYGYAEVRDPLNAARWRYLALRGSEVPPSPFEVVDPEGNPRQQDTLEGDDLARGLSLFIRAVERKDAAAAAALAKQHLDAGKRAESMVLYQFAKDLGNSEAAVELERIQPTVTPEQKKTAEARLPFLLPKQ